MVRIYLMSENQEIEDTYRVFRFDPVNQTFDDLRSIVREQLSYEDEAKSLANDFKLFDIVAKSLISSDRTMSSAAELQHGLKFLLVLEKKAKAPKKFRFANGDEPEELKSQGKTILDILEEWKIGTANAQQMPYYAYSYLPHMPGQRVDTHPEFNRQPLNTMLIEWEGFDQAFQHFYSHPNLLLQTHVTKARLPPLPTDSSEPDELENEAALRYFLGVPLVKVIKPFILNSKAHSIRYEHTMGIGVPGLVLVEGLIYKLIIECKHSEAFGTNDIIQILETFARQQDGNDEHSRAINQVVNYLLLNRSRYAILTTLTHTYAFERVSDTVIRVALVKGDDQLLKLVFYLLYLTTLPDYKEHLPVARTTILPPSYTPANNKPMPLRQIPRDPEQSNSTANTRSHFNVCFHGSYLHQHDVFADDETLDKQVYDHFIDWEFELDPTIVGRGQCGHVMLGQVSSPSITCPVKDSGRTFQVAIKMGDLYKRPHLKADMRNETSIIMYANRAGLECVPTLRWAGYYGYGAQFYVICTDYISGYQKDLDQLSPHEKMLFRKSLLELRGANIVHGDLRRDNVIFTSDRCYILDFGLSTLYTQDTDKPLEYPIGDIETDESVKTL